VYPLKKAILVFFLASTVSFAQDRSAQPVDTAQGNNANSSSSKAILQTASCGTGSLSPGEDPKNGLNVSFAKHLACDQQQFWMAPRRIKKTDWKTLVPFAGFTGILIASDSWLSKQVPDKPNQLKRSNDFSKYGTLSLAGIGGGAFVLGHLTDNDRLKEAGFLGGEAALNSAAVAYALKQITQRPRPYQDNGGGTFFHGGRSFPSEHAAVAWSLASVMAHEYPGTLSQILSYGLATGVTITRVTGQQHFASDAVIGSALGWYFGRQIYRAHHDTSLGGAGWGDLLPEHSGDGFRNPANMGSPYVPMDSWIYPALDRLIGLGYIKTAYFGLRPWSRMTCARMLEEAEQEVANRDDATDEGARIYRQLENEFSDETARLNGAANVDARLDSLYSRFTNISGTPLRDGYHFGQTIIDDYGRPYGEGFNTVAGFTSHAVAGPLSIDVQGEYQHAPFVGSDSLTVLQAEAAQDRTQPFSNGMSATNRFRMLSGTAALSLRGVQISFGKQSLWLGPGNGSPFLFSNNAEPIPMLRIDQTIPVHIPALSRILGPVRSEFFLGQLSGQHWIFSDGQLFGPDIAPQPFIHGSKIAFKPTENLEFGLGYTVLFGGPDLPFTWHNFLRTFTSFNVAPGSQSDPGDRRSTFDFTYRVPYLRDWLTLYADSFVEDEISPLGSTRPSMRMGTYLAHLPGLPKLDLRLEGLYTDVPGQKPAGFLYWNGRYRSGYTNDGVLMANWIGRQGKGGQAWANYWFSPRRKLELLYRHQEVDRVFLSGGRLNDFGIQSDWMLRNDLAVSGMVQYERWNFPLLSTSQRQSNFTASLQMTFYPNWGIRANTP